MAFKGFNSILFDFDSIVDVEITIIRWLAHNYKHTALDWFDIPMAASTSLTDLKFNRTYGRRDLFESFIISDEYKAKHKELIKALLDEYEEDILKFAVKTSVSDLLKAYKMAGDGVIKATVRCETKAQVDYITSNFGSPIERNARPDVDMGKYGRLIIGDALGALEYKLHEPKSILVLDFRENFTDDDITLLRPELVINLGDINDIRVISSYKTDITEPFKG